MSYCLADGTPLVQLIEAGEEDTLVRPSPPAQPTAKLPRRGVSPLFIYLTIGLILLLFMIGGAFGLWLLWSASSPDRAGDNAAEDAVENLNSNKPKVSLPPPSARPAESNIAEPDPEKESLDKERQKLAEERRKLEEAKRKAANSTPAAPANDPPVARINFSRGSTGETVSGTIGRQRGFVLRTMGGQSLSARIRSPDGCVVFNNGSSNVSYSTEPGDNYIYLRNDCDKPVGFSLSVSVR